VLVYVLPNVRLIVSRWYGSGLVVGGYVAEVHELSHYRSQRVYFYRRHGSRGQFTLAASARLRYFGGSLSANFSFHDSASVEVMACVRHRLLADMGPPLHHRACTRIGTVPGQTLPVVAGAR
jgi:hypothetical protein